MAFSSSRGGNFILQQPPQTTLLKKFTNMEASGPLTYGAAVTIDNDGNLYVANEDDYSVSKITPTGTVTTIGSTGSSPRGILVDSSGNIYTTNYYDNNKLTEANGEIAGILADRNLERDSGGTKNSGDGRGNPKINDNFAFLQISYSFRFYAKKREQSFPFTSFHKDKKCFKW